MAKRIKTTFQLKRGESTKLIEQNILLAKGEPAFELDTNRLKIGDGVNRYNDLKYINQELVAEQLENYYTKEEIQGIILGGPVEEILPDILPEILPEILTDILPDVLPDTLPTATDDALGVVKGSEEVRISDDGSLVINQIDASKIQKLDKRLQELEYATKQYVDSAIDDIDTSDINLTEYAKIEEVNKQIANLRTNLLFDEDGDFSIRLNPEDSVSVTDAVKQLSKNGIYTIFSDEGVIDNPVAENPEDSFKGLCHISQGIENGANVYAWILLFDNHGHAYTNYIRNNKPSGWNHLLDDRDFELFANIFVKKDYVDAADAELKEYIDVADSNVKDYVDSSISEIEDAITAVETAVEKSISAVEDELKDFVTDAVETSANETKAYIDDAIANLDIDVPPTPGALPQLEEYTPGALLIADNKGYIRSSTVQYDNLVTNDQIMTGSITISKELKADETDIEIPAEIDGYSSLNVYFNGKLLAENYQYIKVDNKIRLVGFTVYNNDLVSFMGHGVSGSLPGLAGHTHDNKFVLDSITQEHIDRWNEGADSVIDVFKVNGVAVPVLNKTIDITVPTKPEDIDAAPSSHEHNDYVKTYEIIGDNGLILSDLLPDITGTLTPQDREELSHAYEHSIQTHAPFNAEENIINVFKVVDAELPVVNKVVTLPVATENSYGVVKSSRGRNKVLVEEDGTMTIPELDASLLTTADDEEISLDGGSSAARVK